jgi:hypothetical protein
VEGVDVDLAPGRGDGEPGAAAEGLPGGDGLYERVAGEPADLFHFRSLLDGKEPAGRRGEIKG